MVLLQCLFCLAIECPQLLDLHECSDGFLPLESLPGLAQQSSGARATLRHYCQAAGIDFCSEVYSDFGSACGYVSVMGTMSPRLHAYLAEPGSQEARQQLLGLVPEHAALGKFQHFEGMHAGQPAAGGSGAAPGCGRG
jgi:hypothetical protein